MTGSVLRRGSSPHTRGARSRVHRHRRPGRIIPAYAGSTLRRRRHPPGKPDHPRIRGEHSICLKSCHLTMGSSPHTRGARWLRRRPYVVNPDHPRIRGEHDPRGRAGDGRAGSSPHTRGALGSGSVVDPRMRIIPAYAGSTVDSLLSDGSFLDHPRIRGEHGCQAILVDSDFGSSPHTRGAQRLARAGDRIFRIIPAYAGSTELVVVGHDEAQDHPRIRGEHPL